MLAVSARPLHGVSCAGYWRQKLGFDVVQPHCYSWKFVEDPDAFVRRRLLRSNTRLIWIKIDANYFTCAVGNCFWRLYCIRQAYDHAKMDHGNTGQSARGVHVRDGSQLLIYIYIYASVKFGFCGRLSTKSWAGTIKSVAAAFTADNRERMHCAIETVAHVGAD